MEAVKSIAVVTGSDSFEGGGEDNFALMTITYDDEIDILHVYENQTRAPS